MSENREYMEANRRNWDERVPVHYASAFYDVESFRQGRSSLMHVEREEVGDVEGKTMLHCSVTSAWTPSPGRVKGPS